ncbi:flagellar basal body rod protein FlgC [Alteraurantiacibacter aquimixticola]|uniref:Flagellar basal-body rod protein FlgC n=1 Tax=Alteraurantiacibacter aquimixticola TaxID=2489173 RepID=A0A4T3F735_9SPHN|nr:flagellar basal body rod protein FlgC [Alteraurantiacibacter aquimixticola]TIX51512.1 flagellar basal body rod protein FlgC [Alteraurantiacibacter aquimixticola]
MSMSGQTSLFNIVQRGMSAQMIRMNAAASNIANSGSVAGSEEQAYRPVRAVFQQELDQASGMSSVRVSEVRQADAMPIRRHDPGHPLADENGDVWEAPVDETEEMVEIMESARQYQNLVEAMQTAKQLMLETIRSK